MSASQTLALPGAASNGKRVVSIMVAILVLSLALVVFLAELTLHLVPPPSTRAILSGGFIHNGWAHGLKVGQDYGLIIDYHHYNGIVPRSVLQFQGLTGWASIGNQFGERGWNKCDNQYAPRAVSLPGKGLGLDFGVGGCEINLDIRPFKAGPKHLIVRAFVADYNRAGKFVVTGPLKGAVFRWQGGVTP